MDIDSVLSDVGLSIGEIKVYKALLKLGSVKVSKLKEETSLHRTTIYDFIEKLLNKGLVTYVIRNNIKYYNSASPDKLLEYLTEKRENVLSILPDLKNLSIGEQEEVRVEVYKGEEGLKAQLNDIVKTGKDISIFGIDDSIYKRKLPIFMKSYFRKLKNVGIKERALTSEKVQFTYNNKVTTYRYIPDEYVNPTPTMIYGDRIAITIFEPLTVILIQNKSTADNYQTDFDIMWKGAKKERSN